MKPSGSSSTRIDERANEPKKPLSSNSILRKLAERLQIQPREDPLAGTFRDVIVSEQRLCSGMSVATKLNGESAEYRARFASTSTWPATSGSG